MGFCSKCGTQLAAQVSFCANCGVAVNSAPAQPTAAQPTAGQPTYNSSTAPIGVKSRIAAGVLGIVIGGIGIHKFYLGKVGMGILYLLFCWTGVPSIIALVEGIIYLTQTDEAFAKAQGVRVV